MGSVTYGVADGCIDCKDATCVTCCPADCIYDGARTFYIHPDECISCGICVSVCPPEAIHEDVEIPGHLRHFIAINREFLEASVSGLGSPGGADGVASRQFGHPAVANLSRT